MNSIFPQTRCTARRRWMIVDDDENILWLIRKFVARTSDADIECFLSPHEALAAFKAAPESFELVITDLEMPGMDGIELGRQLHALSPTTKIRLATGSGILTATEAVERGFCGLLCKPFPFAVLKNALEFAGVIEPRKTNAREPIFAPPVVFTAA
jgi:DNA-binding NtrC family response regulator